GVAVSTAGNTSSSDFTTIAEWTMTGKGEAKAPRGRGEQGTWYEFVTDLSEYAGQEVYLALRHFNTTDMFILMVDDMVLTNEAKADRALVKYQVLLDGVVEAEELLVPYYQHENVVDGVEYTTTVIASYTMGDSEEMSYTWTKASDTLFAGVRNLAASLEGEQIELSWTLPAPAPEVEETASSFFTDFESGYTGWPMIDADGDGFNWVYSTDYEDVNAFSGTNCMYSESYYNGEGAGSLEPDNYLIIPVKIEAQQGTTLSFMARAQDENWPEEYFGVAVSTTGNELAEDFTTVAEWIIAEDDKNDNVKRGKRGTPWTEFSADLSAYAGQNIWVAIRHFNCYGEFRLNIDDVKVSVEGGKDSKEGTWAYYDNGVNEDAIGGPQSFSWAIKLRAADIAELGALTKVTAFDRVATSGTFDICLGGDNEPGASVLNQAYTWTGINDFVEIPLTEAVDPEGQNVWIVFNTNDGTNYPAAECTDTGDADGRWIYLASDGWFDVTEAGIPCTWMLRGYFEAVEAPEEPEVEEYAIAEILGVMIYRNGELITKQPVEGEAYTDKKGVLGDEYCVQVVYGGAMDTTYYAMSEADCTEAEYIIDCIAPEKLFGQYQYNEDGTFGAKLIWPYSNATTEWLYYDNGVNEDGIGGPASFMWGVMFPSNAISAYDGQFLTKVALFDFAQSSGDINIYYGGSTAPGTLVHTQPYTGTGAGAFVEFD
ncbi:MAG: choice-of-anchor J domain-containing protein, partial [Bacteroidaceae bacterium]|nr:choice-of-anchor J domain-containing protein [Bacteroidaceae bacterium]